MLLGGLEGEVLWVDWDSSVDTMDDLLLDSSVCEGLEQDFDSVLSFVSRGDNGEIITSNSQSSLLISLF